jgi:hypothetical protein
MERTLFYANLVEALLGMRCDIPRLQLPTTIGLGTCRAGGRSNKADLFDCRRFSGNPPAIRRRL